MLTTGTNGSYKGSSNYNASSKCKSYKGFQNVKIKGGKWINKKTNTSNAMRFFHATNVTKVALGIAYAIPSAEILRLRFDMIGDSLRKEAEWF